MQEAISAELKTMLLNTLSIRRIYKLLSKTLVNPLGQ